MKFAITTQEQEIVRFFFIFSVCIGFVALLVGLPIAALQRLF